MFNHEDLQRPGSRFADRVEFVVPPPHEIDIDFPPDDPRPGEVIAETIDGLRSALGEGDFDGFDTGVGRGASGPGLAFALLEGAAIAGGAVGFGHYVWRATSWLREKFGSVTLSHGALKALVVYDVHRRRPDLDDGQVLVVGMTEVGYALEPPELNHTGVDMTTIVLATPDNTESWCYLVLPDGKILHDSHGGPLPAAVALFLGASSEMDWDNPPHLRTLGDSDDG